MFDFSWGEVVVIGVVALVVIGPKELPGVLRTVGQAVGKVRRMAGEFQSQFQEAMREAELQEARKSIEGIQDSVASSFNPIQTIRDEIRSATDTSAPVGDTPATGGDTATVVPETPVGIPEPPPVPDLTPDQIRAAFGPEAEPAAPVPGPASSPEPAHHEPAPDAEPKAKA